MLKNRYFYFSMVVGIVTIRLLLNTIVPLMDKTEARYAEIARLMVETNNWITPQIDYGIPFWAKPPLSTWFSAISMKVFGINEFAVRFPYFLISLAIAYIVGQFAKQKKESLFLAVFILFTLPEFLIHAGVVSTDTFLNFSVVLIMLSYWKATTEDNSFVWKYTFFVGIGLGFLAKGPIVLILTAPPIFLWMVIFGKYKSTFFNLPWISGSILCILIALPWYFFAEIYSPGFIDYFIVGEHFKRFFDETWSGDKYGFPKQQPLGIIWIFLVGFALPWIIYLISLLWKNRSHIFKNQWITFLLLWLLWTPLFFTTSKSLIHTYTLPVMAPIALLILHYYEEIKNKKLAISFALILPILSFCMLILMAFTNEYKYYLNTDKYFVSEQMEKNSNYILYQLYNKSYSSQFYSHGKVKSISIEELIEQTESKALYYIILKKKDQDVLEKSNILENLELVSENNKKLLYKSRDL